MDLTIPYTFYPAALPHWVAWLFFALAIGGAVIVGAIRGRERGLAAGVAAGLLASVAFLVATMLASMVATFFIHDL